MTVVMIVTMMVIDRMAIMIVTMMVIDRMVIRFFVMIMYMRRIVHQRNSFFNNYHRMIGGREDEYWEQRRREWEAWKAEEK